MCGLILSCAGWQHTWPVRMGALAPCLPALDSGGGWSLSTSVVSVGTMTTGQIQSQGRTTKLVAEQEQLDAGAGLV